MSVAGGAKRPLDAIPPWTNQAPLLRFRGEWCAFPTLSRPPAGWNKWERRTGTRCSVCRSDRLGPSASSSPMLLRWLLSVLWALPAEADFFQLDSISNVSTYYFNYFYCNIWEGDCQPHQDDATQQGKHSRQSKTIDLLNPFYVTNSPCACGLSSIFLMIFTSVCDYCHSSYQGPLVRLPSRLR